MNNLSQQPISIRILINVKQPWAWALVNGYKNVENRVKPITETSLNSSDLPEWVGIVASKSAPTSKNLNDLEKLLGNKILAPTKKEFTENALDGKALGAIVGVIRFTGSNQTSKSVWYNGGDDHAWLVGGHHPFHNPILNVAGCQSMMRWVKSHKECNRIKSQLLKRDIQVPDTCDKTQSTQKKSNKSHGKQPANPKVIFLGRDKSKSKNKSRSYYLVYKKNPKTK